MLSVFVLTSLAPLIYATPLIKKDNVYDGSWTPGPECESGGSDAKMVSAILNPPATLTGYEPSGFCSAFLQQTHIIYDHITSSATRTYTDRVQNEHIVTVTDYDHPTSTVYCPLPSKDQVCGIKFSHTIAPFVMGEFYPRELNQFTDPVSCHKTCMEHGDCHSFLVDYEGSTDSYFCDVFYENLGTNGSRAEKDPILVGSGYGWYDRNCPQFMPPECGPQQTTGPDAMDPMITAPPKPRNEDNVAHIERRFTSIPDYLYSDYGYANGFLLSYGCSCIITSALPAVTTTSKSTVPHWLGTTTTTTTWDDYFTVTVTPASTTIFPSIL